MNNRHQERKKEREREMSRSNEGAFFTLSFTVGSCMAADHTPTTHTQTLEETVKSNINVSRKRFEIPWLHASPLLFHTYIQNRYNLLAGWCAVSSLNNINISLKQNLDPFFRHHYVYRSS